MHLLSFYFSVLTPSQVMQNCARHAASHFSRSSGIVSVLQVCERWKRYLGCVSVYAFYSHWCQRCHRCRGVSIEKVEESGKNTLIYTRNIIYIYTPSQWPRACGLHGVFAFPTDVTAETSGNFIWSWLTSVQSTREFFPHLLLTYPHSNQSTNLLDLINSSCDSWQKKTECALDYFASHIFCIYTRDCWKNGTQTCISSKKTHLIYTFSCSMCSTLMNSNGDTFLCSVFDFK